MAWPPRSPDLNPLDYFLWGYLKDKVYTAVPINTVEELTARILAAVRTITPEMLQGAVSGLVRRAQLCIEADGGHFENLR